MTGTLWLKALAVASAVLVSIPAAASTLTVLAMFNAADGASPTGNLIADTAGNLYGTTVYGGAWGYGTVFKLARPTAGNRTWALTVIFSFGGENGKYPSSGVIADKAGNLYGTTGDGGPYGTVCADGCGTVFKLAPPEAGSADWVETQIAAFNGENGAHPGGLISDGAGNLYSGTASGGLHEAPCETACGEIFELTPPAAGKTAWSRTLLAAFDNKDGLSPGGLIFDRAGDLFGVTAGGGSSKVCGFGCGTVFELRPPAAGKPGWTREELFSFNRVNGDVPTGLIIDRDGDLLGTTAFGGSDYAGNFFRLLPPAAGKHEWRETVLTSFNYTNGAAPGGLIADRAGNLYGTAPAGGAETCGSGGCGAVFKLSPPKLGQRAWTQTVVAFFNAANGAGPSGNLLAARDGNLYGTTQAGGNSPACAGSLGNAGCGTVFKLTP